MPIPHLTPTAIQRHTTDKSYARGQSYFQAGAVVAVTQRQQTLQAAVEGNEPRPYRVTIDFDHGGITQTSCTCQYSFEGWCKHVVATLLTCIHQPERVEQRPTLAQLLDRLDWVQTQGLVQSLVNDNPDLIEAVDLYVTRLGQPQTTDVNSAPPQRQTSVDPAPFKRSVREILRNTVRDWEYGREDDDIAADMGALIDNALEFVEQGDVDNAMVVLQGITEGCVENWSEIDEYMGVTPADMEVDLDAAWTEVFLSTELTEEEILTWHENLEAWQDQLGSFAMALAALHQGWKYPPLVKVFAGETTAKGAWSDDAPNWAGQFSQIRLKILARQERYEDYLKLAEAEGQTQQYITMLARLGRIEQALAVAQSQMTQLQEAKALAETLRSQNYLPQALQIALEGLNRDRQNPYAVYDFAAWTSDLAAGLGNSEAALEASIAGFKARPCWQDYQRIQTLAGVNWPEVQPTLLKRLRTDSTWGIETAQIDIFLHEGLFEDAIAVASDLSSYHSRLILQVMDAVIATHSQWVIDNARPRAEAIMDEGKAKYYQNAIDWLKRIKAACQALNRGDEWSHYHRQLTDTHGRKRKLMGLMQQARL
ncbi:MAG: SWIM zinc finger family protein [Cyanobacteria bacterium P01_C01_bin.120]